MDLSLKIRLFSLRFKITPMVVIILSLLLFGGAGIAERLAPVIAANLSRLPAWW